MELRAIHDKFDHAKSTYEKILAESQTRYNPERAPSFSLSFASSNPGSHPCRLRSGLPDTATAMGRLSRPAARCCARSASRTGADGPEPARQHVGAGPRCLSAAMGRVRASNAAVQRATGRCRAVLRSAATSRGTTGTGIAQASSSCSVAAARPSAGASRGVRPLFFAVLIHEYSTTRRKFRRRRMLKPRPSREHPSRRLQSTRTRQSGTTSAASGFTRMRSRHMGPSRSQTRDFSRPSTRIRTQMPCRTLRKRHTRPSLPATANKPRRQLRLSFQFFACSLN